MIKKFYKKVIAQRPEDLSIISALCSQAKVKRSDTKKSLAYHINKSGFNANKVFKKQ